MTAARLVELWRGGLCESAHYGHVVICDAGGVVEAWGDPGTVIYPRSSCKMIQALPLVESGAADAAGLGPRHLALACASHNGAEVHTRTVGDWLAGLGYEDADLRCGAHLPNDPLARRALICSDHAPCQVHNNCSGKHAGFLTLVRHLRAGPEYVEIDHPVQRAVRRAFEEVTGETAAGWGIDGCSAPNFACTVHGLAHAMAGFANARGDARGQAQRRLVQAMMAHPDLVAGEGRACTELMRAAGGRAALKTGAEAVFVAILPDRGLGIALKIVDGGTRAAEAAITALLLHLGVLDAADPVVAKYLTGPILNWRGLATGELRRARGFPA
ncbi:MULTISPECIES: asparaginase [unclassified Paracoccus (in: a-proteobacteria)]|uniref:asparaginase n=1 Tax=unclassified Paracoccus (in: a-proteobacteria) TaxID=2688777 RepID=UPI001353D4E7|nr:MULTISPECIES: asparaginase [unclassified Paracoccus (in: a-proteobacteria)]UXU76005.1 asparaginase [Paracoccus sp. SMMA_5]UXU81915.1 asparaginase [Paracoccus sp. SMMA_5_TC]